MSQMDKEMQAEKEAEMKQYHLPMKKFYLKYNLGKQYGMYPNFAQDLKGWQPYREVKKKFLLWQEIGEAPTVTAAAAAAPAAPAPAPTPIPAPAAPPVAPPVAVPAAALVVALVQALPRPRRPLNRAHRRLHQPRTQ